MANRRAQPVSYRPFRADPLLPDGLLGIAREGGDLERKVADAMFRIGREQGIIADEQNERADKEAARRDALSAAPRTSIETGSAEAGDQPVGGMGNIAPEIRETIVAAARRHNVDPEAMLTTAWLESKGDPNAKNPNSSAGGLFQQIDTNARQYGVANRFDAAQSADGAARFMRDNTAYLRKQLGRDPTRAELYLAHQQGPGGAAKLLKNPQAPAASIVGAEAVRLNGGKAGMTAGEFANLWLRKAGGVTQQSTNTPRIVVSGGGWRPREGTSKRDLAYNAEGTRIVLQQLDNEIRTTTAQAYELHKEDPAQLNAVLDELKAEQLRDHVFPEIAAEYDLAFEAERSRYLTAAVKLADQRADDQNKAAFEERRNEISTETERLLAQAGQDSDSTAGLLQSALTAMDDHYDTGVAQGLLSAEAAALGKMTARRDTAVRFYAAQAKEMSADEVTAFQSQLEDDFAAGALDGIDQAGLDTLKTRLANIADQKQRKAAGIMVEMDRRGSELAERAAAGFELDHKQLNDFVLAAGESDDAETVPAAFAKIEAAEVIRSRPLADAAAYVQGMRQQLPKNPTPAQISAVAWAEQKLASMMELVEKDAAGYAIATGQVEIQPIALDETMETSLALRRDQMEEVAARYNRPLSVLRPAERATLARALTENPEAFPQFASAVRNVFGAKAGTVLAEIAPEAPVLAHGAGLAIATGDDSIATELAQAISAKQKGEFKAKMNDDKFIAAASPELGTSLAFMTGTRSNVMATAALLFERDANLMGFDPKDVDKADSAANVAMRRAVDRALGAQVMEGVKLGGFAQVNGGDIVAPAGMPADRPQRILETLTDADLAVLEPIRAGNDIAITARQLRGAQLVTVGDGVYRVALGDPLGFDPQYVVGQDGDFWTIDMRQLDQARRDGRSSMSIFDWRPSDLFK